MAGPYFQESQPSFYSYFQNDPKRLQTISKGKWGNAGLLASQNRTHIRVAGYLKGPPTTSMGPIVAGGDTHCMRKLRPKWSLIWVQEYYEVLGFVAAYRLMHSHMNLSEATRLAATPRVFLMLGCFTLVEAIACHPPSVLDTRLLVFGKGQWVGLYLRSIMDARLKAFCGRVRALNCTREMGMPSLGVSNLCN
ncbi:hypothetical protein CRG98_007816 [Punica granatum]|uniref:Uncharacterized protein n=1 Tax=Punica granatum TaxID=22663 RepID=A0A2I0KU08_PUNGR|nr:hypothetical protein CRG98_007816 [Punica granatum]